jgi:hypothetical protein
MNRAYWTSQPNAFAAWLAHETKFRGAQHPRERFVVDGCEVTKTAYERASLRWYNC